MSTTKFEFEYDYDFFLIGIFCHHKDYRLAWSMNKHMDFDWTKSNDFELSFDGSQQFFSIFSYFVESQDLQYYLVANRGENGMLIPERKDVDYFLIVDGLIEHSMKGNLLSDI